MQGIYARYLAGASFNDITDHLKEKGPPYDADKPWNKNMVARILEDSRYAGIAITEWDEYQIRALVESVRILSKDEILVRLKSGIEKTEKLQG